MSVLEIIMLLCFGAAWPVSIYRSYVSRTTAGKSIIFLYIVLTGYAAGVAHKVIYSPDIVTYLYGTNGFMVFIDILIFYRNRKIEIKYQRRFS
ncbi:MAG: hypothetical protein AB1632_13145 [Nitrospirota bacterium]